jgi:hypothetical protein
MATLEAELGPTLGNDVGNHLFLGRAGKGRE